MIFIANIKKGDTHRLRVKYIKPFLKCKLQSRCTLLKGDSIRNDHSNVLKTESLPYLKDFKRKASQIWKKKHAWLYFERLSILKSSICLFWIRNTYFMTILLQSGKRICYKLHPEWKSTTYLLLNDKRIIINVTHRNNRSIIRPHTKCFNHIQRSLKKYYYRFVLRTKDFSLISHYF